MQDWRKKIEKKLENVLQKDDTIFANVGKGEVASKKDIEKAFGKKSREEVIEIILEKGELQVGGKERQADLDRIRHEVVNIVAGMLVDPKTKRVYPPTMIEKALEQLKTDAARQNTDKKKPGKSEHKSENNEDEEEKEKKQCEEIGALRFEVPGFPSTHPSNAGTDEAQGHLRCASLEVLDQGGSETGRGY